MRLNIKVIPMAARNEIIILDDKNWKVRVTAAAVDGKANLALLKLLAKELGVAKGQIEIMAVLTNTKSMSLRIIRGFKAALILP